MTKEILKSSIIKFSTIITKKNTSITKAYLKRLRRKYINGNHCFREIDLLIKYLDLIGKNNGILIDVGADVGGFFDSFLWDDYVIFAFEPDSNTDKVLSLTMLSELDNVFYYNKACSNKSGEILPFYTSNESTGISSIHNFHSTHKKTGEVETITLSEFIKTKKIDHVRILKIDTEGHDLFVLEGFPWKYIKPDIIFCEFENCKTIDLGYDYKKLGYYILDRDYKVFVSEWYPVVKYGAKHRWRSIRSFPCELQNIQATGNFICFSKEIWDENYSDFITSYQVKQ